jgi:hypothetical protein
VRALIWLVGFITVQLVAVWPGVSDPSDLQLTPLVAKVITAPYAVSGSDQRIHLVYEVGVANITDGPIRLQRITVRDGQNGTTLTTLDAQAINERFSLGGRRGSESTELGPFQSGVRTLGVSGCSCFDLGLPWARSPFRPLIRKSAALGHEQTPQLHRAGPYHQLTTNDRAARRPHRAVVRTEYRPIRMAGMTSTRIASPPQVFRLQYWQYEGP